MAAAGGAAVRLLPLTLPLLGAFWIAWNDRGSIAARDFLPVSILMALAVATPLLARTAPRPGRAALGAGGLLACLAVWAGLSAWWAPVPSLARDEGLLMATGVLSFIAPLLTLRTSRDRIAGVALVAVGLTAVALATVGVLHGSRPLTDIFRVQRLAFPITYANAVAAFFALGLWPGVALATRRSLALPWRTLALGSATTCAATAALAQSKGATIGLIAAALATTAIVRHRLRFLLVLTLALAPVAVAFQVLTSPYRSPLEQDGSNVLAAATAVLLSGLAAAAIGAIYAALDRRLSLGQRAIRAARFCVALIVAAALVGGGSAFVVHVHHPTNWVAVQWRDFKYIAPDATASTHLLVVGSNRYDFWRVATNEWRRHPIVGIGARGFGAAYLVHGRSGETPARAHSLPFELLSEEGLVGFALALGGFGIILVGLGRRARAGDIGGLAAFAGCSGALVHACFDWNFTFPALTIPFFLLAGIGLAGTADPVGHDAPTLPRRFSLAAGAAAVLLAVLVFAPPWTAAKLIQRGLVTRSQADLRWARRLDPVSADPWIAMAEIAPSARAAVVPLERARARQPRSIAVRFVLGSALFNAGRRAAAAREFQAALRLDPANPTVARALRIARSRK